MLSPCVTVGRCGCLIFALHCCHLHEERCEWLRGVLKVFYQEASQAHASASAAASSGSAMQPSSSSGSAGGGGEDDQLLDVGHHHVSVAERAAGMGSNLSNYGASLGMGLRHAAKHKGGIGQVFMMKKAGSGSGSGSGAGNAPSQAASVGGSGATEQDTGSSECVGL